MGDFAPLGRLLVVFGLAMLVVGALLTFAGRVPRLPGDILIKRDSLVIYLPLATSIVVSVVLTLLLTLLFARR